MATDVPWFVPECDKIPACTLHFLGSGLDPPTALPPSYHAVHQNRADFTLPTPSSVPDLPPSSTSPDPDITAPLPAMNIFPPSLVDDPEMPWAPPRPPGTDRSEKLSTTVEHGRLRFSLNTGVSRDPKEPENIALESYLVRLSLGQQAIALGDVTVQETGLWRPFASRGALGSLDLLGMTGGMFLLKDPAATDEDSMLTGGMIERRLFDSGVRIRAMAALKEDESVTGVGLSTPLLGETLGLSGDLFRSSRGR
jgi:hypothetical protein